MRDSNDSIAACEVTLPDLYCKGCGARHDGDLEKRIRPCCPEQSLVSAGPYIEHLEVTRDRDRRVVLAAIRWKSHRRRLRSGDLSRGPTSTDADHELYDAVELHAIQTFATEGIA